MLRRQGIVIALVLILAMTFAGTSGAEARTQPTPDAATGFDATRAVAIGMGVTCGAVAAAIVADWILTPAYALIAGVNMGLTGSLFSGTTLGRPAIAGSGRPTAILALAQPGKALFRVAARFVGAVSGAIIVDNLYMGQLTPPQAR